VTECSCDLCCEPCVSATLYVSAKRGNTHKLVHAVEPTPVTSTPTLVAYSKEACKLLDLDASECERPEFPLIFSGCAPLPNGSSYAQVYSKIAIKPIYLFTLLKFHAVTQDAVFSLHFFLKCIEPRSRATPHPFSPLHSTSKTIKGKGSLIESYMRLSWHEVAVSMFPGRDFRKR
jgi:hypothetical protein